MTYAQYTLRTIFVWEIIITYIIVIREMYKFTKYIC